MLVAAGVVLVTDDCVVDVIDLVVVAGLLVDVVLVVVVVGVFDVGGGT